jgi:hypothetical protein
MEDMILLQIGELQEQVLVKLFNLLGKWHSDYFAREKRAAEFGCF